MFMPKDIILVCKGLIGLNIYACMWPIIQDAWTHGQCLGRSVAIGTYIIFSALFTALNNKKRHSDAIRSDLRLPIFQNFPWEDIPPDPLDWLMHSTNYP